MKKFLFLFILLFIPIVSSAQMVITEVMYDLEGADSGREWVEVCNTSSESLDMSGWRLYENKTDHKLSLQAGSEVISSGSVAVIADNADTFLLDWPSFQGTLFDSAFSLSNTGETIEIRTPELVMTDSVLYSSEWGASGDGMSLHRGEGEVFLSASPTPGVGECEVTYTPPIASGDTDTSSRSTSSAVTSSGSKATPLKNIRVDAGSDRVVVAGADVSFKAEAFALDGTPMQAQRYVWSYGDGGRGEGEKVSHAYLYPGEYIAFVDITSGEYSASDRVQVKVIEPAIFVSSVVPGREGYIEIENKTAYELLLSGWVLYAGGKTFLMPEHTILKSRTAIKFASEITGLVPEGVGEVILMYPNGRIVHTSSLDEASLGIRESSGGIPEAFYGSTGVQNYPSSPSSQGQEVSVKSDDFVVESEYTREKDGYLGTTASAGNAGIEMKWIVSLGTLILFAIGSVVFLRKDYFFKNRKDGAGDGNVDPKEDAKEYTIKEIQT